MEEFPLPEQDEPRLTDNQIFTRIWFYPRSVFRFINYYHYDKYMVLLLVLVGIANAFDKVFDRNSGNVMSLWLIIILCVIFGGLLGWIGSYIYAALLSWTGTWLKGKANTEEMLKISAYSSIPVACSLILVVIMIAINGENTFKSKDEYVTNAFTTLLNTGIGLADVGLSLWTIILMVVGIAERQQFSIWTAILNLLLPILLFAVPLLAIFAMLSIRV